MGAISRRPLPAAISRCVGLLSVASLLAIGVITPSTAQAAEPAAVTIPQRYLTQTVAWEPCDFDDFLRLEYPQASQTNCANVTVPMDWRHPDDHSDVSIAIAYSKATGVSKGLFTMNPGGPGVPALEGTALFGKENPAFWTDYDLLGMDPRGFGDSERIHCYTSLAKLQSLPQVDDPRRRNKTSHQAELTTAKIYGEACSSTEFSRFVNTQQTVYDLEFLRRYLGSDRPVYDKLNYLGYSYGTWLGTWYADTYPGHTGRFILDSNMNWTSSMYANQITDSFSFQRRRDEMLYPWIARRNSTYRLGKTTAQVKARYENIRADLLAVYRRGGFVISVSDLDFQVLGSIYGNRQFPEAASRILDAQAMAAGDHRVLKAKRLSAARTATASTSADARSLRAAAARAQSAGKTDEEPLEVGGGDQAVRCNDSAYPRNLAGLLRRSDSDAKKYSFIGYSNTVTMCSYWKHPATTRTIDLNGAPQMLMFQSEGDPATAYEGALVAHQATGSHTRMVSVDDEGQHGLFLNGVSNCVNLIGTDFLFYGHLPSQDYICGTSPLPRDAMVHKLDGPLDGKSFSIERRHSTRPPKQPNARLAALLDEAARGSR